MKSHKTKYVLSEWTKDDEKLMAAVEKNQEDKAQNLVVKKGVDPTKIEPNRGISSLHLAVAKGHTAVVDKFLSQGLGSKIDGKDFEGYTAIHHAARSGHYPILQKLLKQKPNLCVFDRQMKSALHHACEGGNLGCVQLLLAENVSVHFKDREGKTALCYAAEKGQASVCRLLIENGSDVNEVDLEGRTPLLWAAIKNHSTVCRYLLQKGADLQATDSKGRTAMWYARSNKDLELEKILQKAETDAEFNRNPHRLNSDKESLDHPYEPIGTELDRTTDEEEGPRVPPSSSHHGAPMAPPPRPQRLPPFTGKSTSLLELDGRQTGRQAGTIGENLGFKSDLLPPARAAVHHDRSPKKVRYSLDGAGVTAAAGADHGGHDGHDDGDGHGDDGGVEKKEFNDPESLDMNLGSFREMLDDAFRKNSLLLSERDWDEAGALDDIKSVSLSADEDDQQDGDEHKAPEKEKEKEVYNIELPDFSVGIQKDADKRGAAASLKSPRRGSYTPMTPGSDASISITSLAQLNAKDAENISLPHFDLDEDLHKTCTTACREKPSLALPPPPPPPPPPAAPQAEDQDHYVSKDFTFCVQLPSVAAGILKDAGKATAIEADEVTYSGILGVSPDEKLLGEHVKLLDELKVALEKRNEMELERIHLMEKLNIAARSEEWIMQELSVMKNTVDDILDSLEDRQSSADVEKLKRDLERINAQLDSLLRMELDEVEDVRVYSQTGAEESSEDRDHYLSKITVLEREKHDLASKLKEILTENSQLHEQAAGIERLMSRARELKQENEGLLSDCRDFVENSGRDSDDMEDLMRLFKETLEENYSLRGENEELLSRLKSSSASKAGGGTDAEAKDLDELKKENVKLMFERMQLEEAVDRQSKDLLDMAEKLRTSEEASRHSMKLETSSNVHRSDDDDNDDQISDGAPSRDATDDASDVDYRQMYEELRSESVHVLDELRAKEALVSRYNSIVGEYEAMARQNEILKNTLEKKSSEVLVLNGRVQDLGDQLEEAFAEFKSAISVMQTENEEEYDKLREENQQLRLYIQEMMEVLEEKEAVITKYMEEQQQKKQQQEEEEKAKKSSRHDEVSQTELESNDAEGSRGSTMDGRKNRSPVYEDLRNAMLESKMLVQENDKLRRQLAELEAEKSSGDDLKDENQKLREANDKLHSEIAGLKRTISEQGAYLAHLSPNSVDIERVEFPSEVGGERIALNGIQFGSKEKVVPLKQEEIKSSPSELEKLTREVIILRSQVECLEKMQDVARNTEEEAGAQRARLLSLEKLCSDLSKKSAEKEEKVLELNETLKEQQKDLMAAKRLESECDKLIHEFQTTAHPNGDDHSTEDRKEVMIARVRDWLEELRHQSSEQKRLRLENEGLREEAKRLEIEIVVLREMNEDLSKQREAEQEEYESNVRAVRERLADESREVEVLKSALVDLSREEASLREQLVKMKDSLLEREREVLLKETEASCEMKALEGEKEELRLKLENHLSKECEEQLLDRIEGLSSQVSNLQRQIDNKNEELDAVRRNMTLEIEMLKENLDASRRKLDDGALEVERERLAMNEKCSRLLVEKEMAEKKYKEASEEAVIELEKRHADELDRSREANSELERKHSQVQDKLVKLEFDLEKMSAENRRASEKIANLEKFCRELENLNDQLKEAQKAQNSSDADVKELRKINIGLREKMNSLEQNNQKLMLEKEQTQLLLEMEKLKNLSMSPEHSSPLRSPQNGFVGSPRKGSHSPPSKGLQNSLISVSPVPKLKHVIEFDGTDRANGFENHPDINASLVEENKRLRKTLDRIEFGFCQPMRLRSESTQTQGMDVKKSNGPVVGEMDDHHQHQHHPLAFHLALLAENRRLYLDCGNLQSSLRRRSSFVVHNGGQSRQPLEQQRQDLERLERAFLDEVASKSLGHLSVLIGLEDEVDNLWKKRVLDLKRGNAFEDVHDRSLDETSSLASRLRRHSDSLNRFKDLLQSVVDNEKFYDVALEELSLHLPLMPELDDASKTTTTTTMTATTSGHGFPDSEESSKLLRQLQHQLMENERKYKEIIQKYRRHLICAVQGQMDPEVKESLLSFIESKKQDAKLK